VTLLWDIIQRHIDEQRYRPNDRQIATALGVSHGTPGNWRKRVNQLPTEAHLRAIARLTGTPYNDVLTAALRDTGYMDRELGDGDARRPAANTSPVSATGDPEIDAIRASDRPLSEQADVIGMILQARVDAARGRA
jgi:transcriptional regulator with XRE-family HTH domain